LGEGSISAIDHVVVKTQDANAAKRFCGDQLGIRLTLEQHVPEWGRSQLFVRASSMSIEVIASENAGEQDELWRLAFKIQNIASTHHRLIPAGCEVYDRREGRKPGTQVCTVNTHTLGVPTLLIQNER